jgi:hypothetical protein
MAVHRSKTTIWISTETCFISLYTKQHAAPTKSIMPAGASPASNTSTVTVKPGYPPQRAPPLATSPASVSTIKPGVSVSHNTIPSCRPLPKSPPKPATPLSPREQFAKFYGFTLPPPPPQSESSVPGFLDVEQVKGDPFTIANSSSTSPFSSPSRWENGPTCASSFAPPFLLPLDSGELLARFNDQFVRARNRMQSAPSSLRKAAPFTGEGVPCPMPSNGVHSDRQVFKWVTLRHPSFTSTRLSCNTYCLLLLLTLDPARPWSYDNVRTYPIMKLSSKKEKRIIKKVVDGEEKIEEIEVEIYEKPKKLFNFAPKVVVR